MINPTGKKLEKLVFGMFDKMVEGADKYVTEQGSTWLIFTEDKKWAVEFTKDRTLWFNYGLFQSELELIGKDCTEERDLIKNWFESRFLGIDVVDETLSTAGKPLRVEDTIQNGVMEINHFGVRAPMLVEKITQIGVKHTRLHFQHNNKTVEDTIQNGVRHTQFSRFRYPACVEDTIQNGVRHTNLSVKVKANQVEDTIQNGVKDTVLAKTDRLVGIEDTIENGVKKIRWNGELGTHLCEDVIENGVKYTESLPENNPARIQDTIKNGIKDMKESHFYRKTRITDVTQNGVKEIDTKELSDSQVNRIIKNSIKEK